MWGIDYEVQRASRVMFNEAAKVRPTNHHASLQTRIYHRAAPACGSRRPLNTMRSFPQASPASPQ